MVEAGGAVVELGQVLSGVVCTLMRSTTRPASERGSTPTNPPTQQYTDRPDRPPLGVGVEGEGARRSKDTHSRRIRSVAGCACLPVPAAS